MNRYKFFFLCVGLLCGMHLSAKDYYATDFGVKADGKTLNTNSIQKGIDFVNEQGGGRLVFTTGNYLTGTIYLKSNVTLHLEEGATLLGSTNPWDYEKDSYIRWMSMILQSNSRISVSRERGRLTDAVFRLPIIWWTISNGASMKTR